MKHVVVSARRAETWWELSCAESGVTGRCKRLETAADRVREAIADALGLPSDGVEVEIDLQLPSDYRELARTAAEYRDAADAANLAADSVRRQAAKVLAAQQMTVRDIGRVMGISHQSVHRMLKDSSTKSAG